MIIVDRKDSIDGTTKKYFFSTGDNYHVEACIIVFDDEEAKYNICVSSQIFCNSNCVFCVSGTKTLVRNLYSEEIFQQVELILNDQEENINGNKIEITYMGSGDPLYNLENVLSSAKLVIEKYRDITYRVNISTILPIIGFELEKFSFLKGVGHIQYSLIFTNDQQRHMYMNINLPSISDSLTFLKKLTNYLNDKLCINYLLFDGVNDSIQNANELCEIARKLNSYIKISSYNSIPTCKFKPSMNKETFIKGLTENNAFYKESSSKGTDIYAGCGNFYSDTI